MIPRSAAIFATVADPVVRYSSTASRRNSAEYVFLAMSRSSRFLQAKPGFSVSTLMGQGPLVAARSGKLGRGRNAHRGSRRRSTRPPSAGP